MRSPLEDWRSPATKPPNQFTRRLLQAHPFQGLQIAQLWISQQSGAQFA
jgi:hypothetical protein